MDPHNDVPGKKRSILWIKEGLQSTLTVYLMDPHNDVPGKKRSILWIKEGLQSTLTMYLMDPHNDVPGKKRSILWIKEGLQSTLKPFPTRRRKSPLTVRILSSNSHGRFQRLADPKLILRHDPEVVLVAFDQPHDLEVEVTDELADGFPFSCLHVLLLHNVVGDWAPAILLATHPDITCIPLSSSFFLLKVFSHR